MKHKCIAMLSGGLDSRLALKLMVLQDIEVIAFYGSSVFHEKGDGQEHLDHMREVAMSLGASKFVTRDMNKQMISFTKSPQYGYGKHMNACLDCRLAMITVAKEVMLEEKADFIITGEVVGQRPMSQRRAAMDKLRPAISKLELDGLVLRPLSAKLFEPTIPEANGWVNRDELLEFSGRTRKPQMKLADDLGVTDYPSPAGGCLLTLSEYSIRLCNLMKFKPDLPLIDIRLLRVGRHYRINPETKVIVSRNEAEGIRLEGLAQPEDFLYMAKNKPGASVLIRGTHTAETDNIAAGLALYFSKHRDDKQADVLKWQVGASDQTTLEKAQNITREYIDSLVIEAEI